MTVTQDKRDSYTSRTSEERQRMIAEAAYFKAERRDFLGGSPDNDWLEAEAELDAMEPEEVGHASDLHEYDR